MVETEGRANCVGAPRMMVARYKAPLGRSPRDNRAVRLRWRVDPP
jgi:hypothetical protein